MRTLVIIQKGRDEFVEVPCKCGCGQVIQVKLPKYKSIKCYAKSLEKKKC